MGCEEVALSDTDGLASPRDLERVILHIKDVLGLDHVAVHLHDRRGLGITNAYSAYQMGVRVFDASIGGIGGAITVRHSIGNIATEELVCMFDSLGVETGIDVQPLIEAGCLVSQMADFVGDPPPPSRVILDELTKRRAEAEETEGIEADLSVKDLASSLLHILGHRPTSVAEVGHTLSDAGTQLQRFWRAPTNFGALLMSVLLIVGVAGIGRFFVRLLPSDWATRSEVIAITLFSLLMVLLLGGSLTVILTRGMKLPRKLTERERSIVLETVSETLADIDEMAVGYGIGGRNGRA
jgi:hypothetical protein